MSGHTPGPWGRNIPPASKYPIIYAGRNTHVAQLITSGFTFTEAEANADLIANAPDLLEALRQIVALPLGSQAARMVAGNKAVSIAKEAIAKAVRS